MPRPLWSGTIQISLVGFAVEVYPATSTTRPISFHEVDRNTLSRVHHQKVSADPAPAQGSGEAGDAEDTSAKHKTSLHIAARAGEHEAARETAENVSQHTLEKGDIVKGYEYEKGKYAIVEPAELKNLRLAGKKTVEISQFARATEINPVLYDKPYFVLPKDSPQAKAFAVVRQGMIDTGMVGVGEIVFSGRQHLMTLAPPHDPEQPGMMLYTLRFATELRDVHDYFKDVGSMEADAAQLGLAKQLIDAYTQPFEVGKFRDHYEDALRELVEAKVNHVPAPTPAPEKKPGKVIDLMDALRRSLAQRDPSQAESAQQPVAESAMDSKPPKKPSRPSAAKTKTKTAGAGRSH
jgi:DNA end-binding protein Ku